MTIKDVWVHKYRPTSLEDMILSEKNRQYFSSINKITNNYLFLGKAGIGKSTMAAYLRDKFAPESYLYLNASAESGIDTVRNKIQDFVETTSFDGSEKLVILSEFDGFSRQGQEALREIMELYIDNVKFILTANYRHKIIEAIQSRCEHFDFTADIKDIAKRMIYILKNENIADWQDHKNHVVALIRRYAPDIRRITNELQSACVTGKFVVPDEKDGKFVTELWTSIKAKEDVFVLRKKVIDSEHEYDNDYHQLMHSLFDCATDDKNVGAMILIAEFMKAHNQVVDPEINFIHLLLKLSQLK